MHLSVYLLNDMRLRERKHVIISLDEQVPILESFSSVLFLEEHISAVQA
jgi:hypothetical protein